MERSPISLYELKNGMYRNGDKDFKCKSDDTFGKKPNWYNDQMFKKGQEFFSTHRGSIFFSYLWSIMIGFSVDSLTDALVYTGASSGSRKTRQRYMKTLLYLVQWHNGGDVFDATSTAAKAMLQVRSMHSFVRKNISDSRSAISDYLDDEAAVTRIVLPMNQYDMALVQAGFIGPILIWSKELGINCKKEDTDNYVHFWRVIGWCLGISDEFNICGNGTSAARSISNEVLNEIIVPGLKNPSPNFNALSKDFEDGFSGLIPGFTRPALYQYIFPIMGLSPPKIKEHRQYLFYYAIVSFTWLTYNFSFFRVIFNTFLYMLERLQYIYHRKK